MEIRVVEDGPLQGKIHFAELVERLNNAGMQDATVSDELRVDHYWILSVDDDLRPVLYVGTEESFNSWKDSRLRGTLQSAASIELDSKYRQN